MPRVVHFEVSAEEPERAGKFYQDVFGWKIEKWGGPQEYWMITTGEGDQSGINGGMMRRCEQFTAPTINTIDVPSVDDFLEKVTAHGGDVVMPKTPIPGVGHLAYCHDTEGNVFGIMQEDRTAAA